MLRTCVLAGVLATVSGLCMPSPLRRIRSESEFAAVEPPPDNSVVQMLMIAHEDCKYRDRMERAFSGKCAHDGALEGLLWVVADEVAAEALGATRSPYFVAFREGEKCFDFVAQSPGALHFGILELGTLVAAYEEEGR